MEIPQAKHGYARDSIEQSKLVNPPWRSKELNKVVVEDQKSKRKTIKTLLTEALAQLRSERCRIFKWIGKFNAIMWNYRWRGSETTLKLAARQSICNTTAVRPLGLRLKLQNAISVQKKKVQGKSQSNSTMGLKKLPSW